MLTLREMRAGFVGSRLPAAHQDVSGLPPGRPVPANAPPYMGFKSGLRVTHRANYVVPSRALRSFPLLPGREEALRA